jgi:hypothetical protein
VIKIGDEILVTGGTRAAIDAGWVGTIKRVIRVDEDCTEGLGFKVTGERFDFWVSGVAVSSLIKELM